MSRPFRFISLSIFGFLIWPSSCASAAIDPPYSTTGFLLMGPSKNPAPGDPLMAIITSSIVLVTASVSVIPNAFKSLRKFGLALIESLIIPGARFFTTLAIWLASYLSAFIISGTKCPALF